MKSEPPTPTRAPDNQLRQTQHQSDYIRQNRFTKFQGLGSNIGRMFVYVIMIVIIMCISIVIIIITSSSIITISSSSSIYVCIKLSSCML